MSLPFSKGNLRASGESTSIFLGDLENGTMNLSRIALRLLQDNGIQSLMEDLGSASQARASLGGGNPAKIPEAKALWEKVGQEIFSSTQENGLLEYAPPTGSNLHKSTLAAYLSQKFSVSINSNNISFTNGSQNAFSFLLNSFSGLSKNGAFKKIIFPMVPEYIGYSDQAFYENQFLGILPKVRPTTEHRFLYELDIDSIPWEDAGALCLSRPSNPTGSVIPKDQLDLLYQKCQKYEIPLIIDNAYGFPFPNLMPVDEIYPWKPGMIFVHSFSKVGLPGLRVGFILHEESLSNLFASWASVHNLAVSLFSVQFVLKCLESSRLDNLCSQILKPFYDTHRQLLVTLLDQEFQKRGIPYLLHEPRGAFFVWIWFPKLSISSQELYQRCKERGLLLVSGHYFFPGNSGDFSHKNCCVRLTFSCSEEEIAIGVEILAQFLEKNALPPSYA